MEHCDVLIIGAGPGGLAAAKSAREAGAERVIVLERDITRKKKLLEKQKEGKKRMRQIGSVELPSEAFMSVLRIN